MTEIEGTLANETERVNFRELLDPGMNRCLLLGVVLAVFQQWCGINVIFNYAEEIFKNAGYGISDALANIVCHGRGQHDVHVIGHGHRRSRRPPAPDAPGVRRAWRSSTSSWASAMPSASRAGRC